MPPSLQGQVRERGREGTYSSQRALPVQPPTPAGYQGKAEVRKDKNLNVHVQEEKSII